MNDYCSFSGCVNVGTITYKVKGGTMESWCSDHDPGETFRVSLNGKKLNKPTKSRADTQTQCVWCGCDLDELTVTKEHVVPKSRGGKGYLNTAPACQPCNQDKGNLDAREYIAVLRERRRR